LNFQKSNILLLPNVCLRTQNTNRYRTNFEKFSYFADLMKG